LIEIALNADVLTSKISNGGTRRDEKKAAQQAAFGDCVKVSILGT
jgi:hypothetical protein